MDPDPAAQSVGQGSAFSGLQLYALASRGVQSAEGAANADAKSVIITISERIVIVGMRDG